VNAPSLPSSPPSPPSLQVNPDEAIALGCAVQAASLDGLVGDLRLVAAAPNRGTPAAAAPVGAAAAPEGRPPEGETPASGPSGRGQAPPPAAKLPAPASNRQALMQRALREAKGV
jgi:hypothetical protein